MVPAGRRAWLPVLTRGAAALFDPALDATPAVGGALASRQVTAVESAPALLLLLLLAARWRRSAAQRGGGGAGELV